MRAGDIVALYLENFRLAVAVDGQNLVVIYRSNQVVNQSIDLLLNNIGDLSSILSTEVLPEDHYEIYKTNILITPKLLKKTTKELIKFLVINLKKMPLFSEGDILKMEGPMLLQFTIYNHFVIFSGIFIFLLLINTYYLFKIINYFLKNCRFDKTKSNS